MSELLAEVRSCRLCANALPLGPRPVLSINPAARVLIIGQAPGTWVHRTGVPWNDPSGDRLRDWMGIQSAEFYDDSRVAIMPMGFCYPGRGPGGDLPPRPECAPRWHAALLARMPAIRCTLLIGHYALSAYRPELRGGVGQRVSQWRSYAPTFFLLPHPSPRNRRWLAQRPWFEADVVPALKTAVRDCLDTP